VIQDFLGLALRQLDKGIDARSVQCLLVYCHLCSVIGGNPGWHKKAQKYFLLLHSMLFQCIKRSELCRMRVYFMFCTNVRNYIPASLRALAVYFHSLFCDRLVRNNEGWMDPEAEKLSDDVWELPCEEVTPHLQHQHLHAPILVLCNVCIKACVQNV
jgi:hypothetical protein